MKNCRFCGRDVSRDDLHIEASQGVICEKCFDSLPADRRLFRLSRPKGDRFARVFAVTLVSSFHDGLTAHSR